MYRGRGESLHVQLYLTVLQQAMGMLCYLRQARIGLLSERTGVGNIYMLCEIYV